MFTFSWEISLGTILAVVTVCTTVLGTAYRARYHFEILEKKVNVLFAVYLKDLESKGIDVTVMRKFFNGETD